MDYFPVFTRMDGRACLIVGAGSVAERKARLLLAAGAKLHVVAPAVSAQFQQWELDHSLTISRRHFRPTDVSGCFLVIGATNDSKVNAEIFAAADERQIFCNSVDDPDASSAIMPAIVDRSPLLVAISSGGKAPVLLRRLRESLERQLPQGLAQLAASLGQLRPRIAKLLSPGQPRRQFWERFLDGAIANKLQAGKPVTEDALEREVQRVIQGALESQGQAWLVGAGPGNPDLLTLRALQLMQQADVVLYDSLVSEQVLARVRRDATRICVGKRAGRPSMAQEAINRLLVNKVRQGHKVLRLKGGDPFVFGRGGEEMRALQENELPFEVVPGITAALACAAATGIPVTHRDFAHSLSIVTGRLKRGEPQSSWKAWSGRSQTLAIYMGLGDRERIAQELMVAGRAADTPIAIVSNGTLATQQTTVGTLDELRRGTLAVPAATPAMLYVGEVCRFADARRLDLPGA